MPKPTKHAKRRKQGSENPPSPRAAEPPVNVESEEEVRQEFDDVQNIGSGSEQLSRRLRDHHSQTPKLSGGDIDAAWDQADAGDETVGGSNPTPDQDVVDELGEALGVTYQDNEELGTTEKLEKRDRKRWDLDPASSEDYQERSQGPRHENDEE
jgi:hypothetical protein